MRRAKPTKPKASTADVIGAARDGVRVARKWKPHYQHLLRLRDAVVRRQSGLAQAALEDTPQFSTHMADAGTDAFDRDLVLGMLSNEHEALWEIEQALDRIRTGSYGLCELTGKPIEPDRLEAIPWTRFSKAAGRKLEREGEIKRVHLGPRAAVGQAEPEPDQEQEEPD